METDKAAERVNREDHGEVRKTDPKTGGQKGVKDQRYDLIPRKQWDFIREIIPLDSSTPIRRALDMYDDWWLGRRRNDQVLIEAAGIAMRHLGEMIIGRGALTSRDLAEECLAMVYGFGAKKYDDDNWKRGYAWGFSWAAGRRHMLDHIAGNTHDDGPLGSGLPHLAHFIWHCITLHWFTENMPLSDPRVKP